MLSGVLALQMSLEIFLEQELLQEIFQGREKSGIPQLGPAAPEPLNLEGKPRNIVDMHPLDGARRSDLVVQLLADPAEISGRFCNQKTRALACAHLSIPLYDSRFDMTGQ
jgi:hypothetical protein